MILTSIPRRDILAALGLVLGVNLLVAWYILAERTVYYWDYANYWNQFGHYTNLLRNSPLDALRELIGSVRYAEYNGIAAFLLAPFGLLFGTSRLSYVLLVTNLYALPAVAIAAWAAMALPGSDSRAKAWCMTGLFLPCAALWHPVLRGFETVGGLIPIFFLLGLWFRKPLSQWGAGTVLFAGFCLASLILFRRIYAYWAAGFMIAAALVELAPALREKTSRLRAVSAVLRLAAAGLVSILLLFLVAAPMALSMIRNDYAALYSIYRISDSPWHHLSVAVFYFGIPLALMSAAGWAFGLGSERYRRPVALLSMQLLVTFFWFIRVQDFHRHHYYNLLPALLLGALCLVLKFQQHRWVSWTATGLTALGSVLAFIPPATFALPNPVVQTLAPARAHPLIRRDMDSIHRLLASLDAIPAAHDSDRGVYVLASSDLLNDEMLRQAKRQIPRLPSGGPLVRATANKSDAKFGFPTDLLRAEVLVVASPVQIHLAGERSQPTIRAPWTALQDSSGFGGAYRKLDLAFPLDREVTVTLWQRVQARFTRTQLDSLLRAYAELVPADETERVRMFLSTEPVS
jgi:lipoprotein signal peptidase